MKKSGQMAIKRRTVTAVKVLEKFRFLIRLLSRHDHALPGLQSPAALSPFTPPAFKILSLCLPETGSE